VNKLKILGLAALFIFGHMALAQSTEELDTGETPAAQAPAQAPSTTQPQAAAPTAAATSTKPAVKIDFLQPGWNPYLIKYGVGYAGSFLNGSNTFIFERFLGPTSYSIYFGINKVGDTYTSTDTSATTGTGPFTTTTTHADTGVKNPLAISLGASYNKRLYRNEWIMVRLGMFGGLDYFNSVSYNTGTSATAVNSATGNATVTQTAAGTVTVKRSPVFRLGPVFDSFVSVRWLPQLAIGMQGGMLYGTNFKTSTRTTTTTQTYQVVGGVPQTPTAYTTSDSTADAIAGPSFGTIAVNGTTFNLMGNFVLRYVW
jgi:hypothetical protein